MSRQVTHDGMGTFQVRFPFDRSMVDRVKTLPNRRWNASEKYWSVPEEDVVPLVDLLVSESFRFDRATCEIYRQLGGSMPLGDRDAKGKPAADPGAPTLPGLFDEPAVESGSAVADGDYTVASLNERVRELIESAFPSNIWLVGEISGFNKSAHKRTVGFQLVEIEDDKVVSQINTTLFERDRKSIEQSLKAVGCPFRLEDEVSVRLRVRVSLYVPWGSYRVIAEGIDVNYTLGEAARRREEIVRRLTGEGLIGVNSELQLPALPLRVGLVTSLGSDAFNDVLRSFQESGLAFEITAHGARVQGRQTEPSVLNALDWFRERHERFDVVMICRGGGSRTDLAWFDSLQLGRAVAGFPLPVIVGIGHEKDASVLDAVARGAKTPTAAAAIVVDQVRGSMERLDEMGRQILETAAIRLREQRQEGLERIRRLGLASRGRLSRERQELGHQARRTVRGSRSVLAACRTRLAHWMRLIPNSAAVQIETRRYALNATLRATLTASHRTCETARCTIDAHGRDLPLRGGRSLQLEREKMEARGRRLRLVDPRRVVERGYAIVRLDDGKVLTDADHAPAGTPLRAELRRGSLALRSEGTEREGDERTK